ncbi:MAG: GNAT family N-acetyltransferase [Chloroflexi bacterium]|nr:MAG: GNAT family N-acetyltransferase [Chloroflexota bacterium]
MRLTVEPARTEELDLVLNLLEDASRWLLAKGVEQWHAGQWKREKIAAAMERGEVFLAWEGATVVATISLQWSDELLWPAAAGDAGYVHRLAVASDAHGRGLGRALLDWAGREIARRGRSQLRLDCACDNPGLRRYYEELGFRHRGDRPMGRYCASLYERALQ